MFTKRISILLTLLIIASAGIAIGNDKAIDNAKNLFAKYIELEHAFDPSCAELYAEEAVIKNRRIYPNGEIKELSLPASRYKQLIKRAMPLAKLRGDTNRYSQIQYTIENDGVRITAERYSNLKKYQSPLSLFVKPSAEKEKWLIYEEISESRP